MEVRNGANVGVGAGRVVGSVGGWRVAAVDKPSAGPVTINGPDSSGVGGLEASNSGRWVVFVAVVVC